MNKTTNWLLLIIVLVLLFGTSAVLWGIFWYIAVFVLIIAIGLAIGFPAYLFELFKEKKKTHQLANHHKHHKDLFGVDTSGRYYSGFELALRGCEICSEESDPVKLDAFKNNKFYRKAFEKNKGICS